jgi:hypothetical protein
MYPQNFLEIFGNPGKVTGKWQFSLAKICVSKESAAGGWACGIVTFSARQTARA